MASHRRVERESEVVFVEGQTEERYLSAARDWHASPHIAKIVLAKGAGGLIRSMERTNLNAYTRIWIVLDAEKHPHGECARAADWVSRQQEEDRFAIIITAPRIEAWLLAHWETPRPTGAACEARLTELTAYRKPTLPPGLPLDQWRSAARRLPPLAPGLPTIGDECPLCIAGSALPWLVAELRGESWPSERSR